MSKFGVIHYNTPGATIEEFLKWAADTGFAFVELMPTDVKIDVSDEAATIRSANDTRAKVRAHGLRVSAYSAGNDFLQADDAGRDAQIAKMLQVMDVTRILDEEAVVRTEGGWEKDAVPKEQWENALYECFVRCAEPAQKKGVVLAIDNHGTVTNNGDLLLLLLRRVKSPSIGSNLDTMNFRWLGNDVATCNRFYEELAPFVKNVHMKDGFDSREHYRGAALGEGEIDLDFALKCLKSTGYSGAYTAEYEGPETAGGVGYGKCLQWLKARL